VSFLAALLALSPQGDAGAELLYRTLSTKIEDAKTLRAEWSAAIGDGRRQFALIAGSLKAKGKDRWIVETEIKEGVFRLETGPAAVLQSDGRRVIPTGREGVVSGEALTPAALGREIRHALVTALIGRPMDLVAGGGVESGENREPLPQMGPIKSAGREKVGTREALILESTLKAGEHTLALRLWVDAESKLPIKREMTDQGISWTETFSTLILDEEIPDSVFAYQSRHRLAQSRASQVAESVRLYARFTGRAPGTLEDLIRRPAGLEPEIFYPPGGFVLGGTVPRDPWGRPFELRADAEGVRIVSLGADGKPGGSGDDEDVQVGVPAATRRAVGSGGGRLDRQFAARIELELLAAAVRAYLAAYGELPRTKAALWERPEWAEVWPEGGWIGADEFPNDPWGEPYRVVRGNCFVRVQVSDPKARLILASAVRSEERARLDEAARPRLSAADRAELLQIFGELGDDDLETREKAEARLARWGSAALELLEARAKSEKDREARSRLEHARDMMPPVPAPWRGELAPLLVGVTGSGGGDLQQRANERKASTSLQTLAAAEADFRSNDRDGNRVNDFWTGDVAGLYTLKDPDGNMIKLIELGVALADAAPLGAGAAQGRYVAPSTLGTLRPKAGYYFRAMTHDTSSGKSEPYAISTGGEPDLGKVHHLSSFGFCAYPAEYGVSGTRTFIINEGNTIAWKDTMGEPVLEFPSDAELAAGWQKLN